MLTRFFNAAGLIVQIAKWKACLLAFAARRSALALIGYLFAAIVALGGLALLLGAGYVALAEIVGPAIALVAVGDFLLLTASIIWIIANRRGNDTGHAMTEEDARKHVETDEHELRSTLGVTNNKSRPDFEQSGPRGPYIHASQQPEPPNSFDSPKVVMAAGFALLTLLGPGRLFRAVRVATALASIAALANRAINDQRDKQAADRAP